MTLQVEGLTNLTVIPPGLTNELDKYIMMRARARGTMEGGGGFFRRGEIWLIG